MSRAKRQVNRAGNTLILLLLTAVALGLRLHDVTRPFDNGLRGECGAAYSLMAENLLRYGARATGLLPVLNTLPVSPEHFVYYEHHPPGMVILTASIFSAAGRTDEWTARLLPVLLSLLSLGILFLWVRRSSGEGTAIIAAALGATLPLSAYYGPFLNFETFFIPPLLGFLYCHLRWMESGQRRYLFRALALLCLGVCMDWAVLLGLPAVALDARLFRRKNGEKERRGGAGRALLLYTLAGACVFAGIQAWFALQIGRHGAPSQDLAERLLYYREATFLGRTFHGSAFFHHLGAYFERFATWPVLVAAAAGLLLLPFRPADGNDHRSMEVRGLLLLSLPGILNLLVFANHASRHEYWILPLYPPLCWCAALGFHRMAKLFLRRAGPYRLGAGAVFLLAAFSVIHGTWRTVEITAERRGREELFLRGKAYGALAEGKYLLLTPARSPAQVIRYAGGRIYPYAVPDPAALAAHRALLEKYGYLPYPRLFAVPLEERQRFRDSLKAFSSVAEPVTRKGFLVIPLP